MNTIKEASEEIRELISRDKLENALKVFKLIAIKSDFDSIFNRYKIYKNLIISGRNYEEINVEKNKIAYSIFLSIEKLFPDDKSDEYVLESELLKVYILISEEEYNRAFFTLNKIKEDFPNNDEVYFKLGIVYHNLGFEDKAIKEYLKVKKEYSQYDLCLYNLGLLYQVNDPSKGFDYLFRAFLIGENNRSVELLFRGICSGIEKLDPSEVELIIDDYFKKYGNIGILYFLRGYYIETTKKLHKESIEFYKEALKYSPNLFMLHYYLADSYNMIKDKKMKLASINNAVLFIGDSIAYSCRASIYYNEGKYQKAINDYTKMIKMDGESNNVLEARASCFYKLGKIELALKDLNQAISLNPSSNAFFNIAISFKDNEKFDEAISSISRAIKLEKSVKNLDFRAYLYSRIKDETKQIHDLISIINIYDNKNITVDDLLKDTFFDLIPLLLKNEYSLEIIQDFWRKGIEKFNEEYRFYSFEAGIQFNKGNLNAASLMIKEIINTNEISLNDDYTYIIASEIFKSLKEINYYNLMIQKEIDRLNLDTHRMTKYL